MMSEIRFIKASILTGATDIVMGIIFYLTGFADWYYAHFHVFGIFGLSMMIYGYWHLYFLRKETGSVKLWTKKQ